MRYQRGSILLAGLLLGLLLMLGSIGLPYHRLDWMVFSQPYEPTQTPTSTSVPTATFTPTSVTTSTATVPPATVTATPTTPDQDFINYLPLIRRSGPVTGSVVIEGGRCCAGGTAGSTIEIGVAFQATSPFGDVRDMRLRASYGGRCLSGEELAAFPWEPFVSEKTFPVTVVINWVGFYVSAQYRDAAGHLSPAYCDDISVEGMPPHP
ncbi:MAG: hypothetical protein D6791_06475 [Chloroflexi bacterium]|nr:MAG: hypothetical protein D6791_06475 [Chloroflexota bacterium]